MLFHVTLGCTKLCCVVCILYYKLLWYSVLVVLDKFPFYRTMLDDYTFHHTVSCCIMLFMLVTASLHLGVLKYSTLHHTPLCIIAWFAVSGMLCNAE